MSKLIIYNYTSNITDSGCMDLIQIVMMQGTISKHDGVESYCHATTFDNTATVYCHRLKSGTVKFTVTDQ